jgi:hypothetical protein
MSLIAGEYVYFLLSKLLIPFGFLSVVRLVLPNFEEFLIREVVGAGVSAEVMRLQVW